MSTASLSPRLRHSTEIRHLGRRHAFSAIAVPTAAVTDTPTPSLDSLPPLDNGISRQALADLIASAYA